MQEVPHVGSSAGDALTAHGDAWEQLGRIHAAHGAPGAGAARVPGARLMASGLPHPTYNNADITDPYVVDLDAVRAWYDARGVPWGVRVPAGSAWDAGRHLFRKNLRAVGPTTFVPATPVPGLTVTMAEESELTDVAAVDTAAFGGTAADARAWLGPLVADPSAHLLVARLDGRPVAAAYTVTTEFDAGRAAYLAGVGVVPGARRRGIAHDLSSRLVEAALDRGAEIVHGHPEQAEAVRVSGRLGFAPAGAFDIYVDLG